MIFWVLIQFPVMFSFSEMLSVSVDLLLWTYVWKAEVPTYKKQVKIA